MPFTRDVSFPPVSNDAASDVAIINGTQRPFGMADIILYAALASPLSNLAQPMLGMGR